MVFLPFPHHTRGCERVSRVSLGVQTSSVPPGATWSPTSFIVDDGQDPDGLNLGSVVVDEEKGLVILIYSLHFHTAKNSGTMMVQSQTDGLSWSRPRNISGQIGVQPFGPGPGFGLQVRKGCILVYISIHWNSCVLYQVLICVSLRGRNVTAQLKGGWWCVATAVWRQTEFSAY